MEHGINNPGEQPQPPITETQPPTFTPQVPPTTPQPSAPAPRRPSLVFPIIATVLFWPGGVAAIVKMVSARRAFAAADFITANKDARSAKMFSIVSTCIGALGWLLSIVFLVVSLNLATAQYSSGDDETPTYSASAADGPTTEVTFRLKVDKGTARHEFNGTLGGKNFENVEQPDSEFKTSLTKTILIDKDDPDFTVYVYTESPGATVSCELEVDGKVVVKQSDKISTYCSMYMVEDDASDDGASDDSASDDTASDDDASSKDSTIADALKTPKYVVGDCVNTVSGAAGVTSEKIDCAKPHDGQVTHVETLPEGEYPGKEAITAQADTICSGDVFTSFIGIPFSDSTLSGSYMYPQPLTWMQGDRQITCLVHEAEGQTTGSLQGAAR